VLEKQETARTKLVRQKAKYPSQKGDHENLFLGLVASWLLGHFCHIRTTS
jgi:hypothetical protein